MEPFRVRPEKSRMINWTRLRVYFGTLLLTLFGLGGLLLYASSLADPASGQGRSRLRTLGMELMALSLLAGVFAAVLKRRLWREDR
jgi:hypothetical protein